MKTDYLRKILSARVYDVAIESPLELAPAISRRTGNHILLKREDKQPVFSFKLRAPTTRWRTSSPSSSRARDLRERGQPRQGVALGARSWVRRPPS